MAEKTIPLMAHLMRRAGFGASYEELEARAAEGYEATVEELPSPEDQPDLDMDLLQRRYIDFKEMNALEVNQAYEYRPDGKRITICTIDEEYVGEFARGGTSVGESAASSADGSLIWPTSIALDRDGNVYVADEWLNRMSIFTRDGDYTGNWERPGSGDGEVGSPSGLAFPAALP